MKHITTYKLFEKIAINDVTTDIVIYLKDIFQELEDVGFNISIDPKFNTTVVSEQTAIVVNIFNKQKLFLYKDVQDTVESSIDYMNSIGFVPISFHVEKYISGSIPNKVTRWYRHDKLGDVDITLPDPDDKLMWAMIKFNLPF